MWSGTPFTINGGTMKYYISEPPIHIRSFKELKKAEAQVYYDWYIGECKNRILLLKERVNEDIDCSFDYSVDSLKVVWSWFEKNISFEELSEEEYANKLNDYPEWMHPYVSQRTISMETLIYGLDIAIYFAEVIVRNNPSIHWGYYVKPKNRSSVNQPVLLGFKFDKEMNPREIVVNCIRKSDKELDQNRLYDLYHVWKNFI